MLIVCYYYLTSFLNQIIVNEIRSEVVGSLIIKTFYPTHLILSIISKLTVKLIVSYFLFRKVSDPEIQPKYVKALPGF